MPNFVNLNKFHRSSLNECQKLFLTAIMPVGQWIQEQVLIKCAAQVPHIPTKFGIFSSVIIAHCIYKSNWGSHPAAQDRFYLDSKNWVHGNNLWCKESGKVLRRDSIKLDGKQFRSYQDWGAFATDCSDALSWQEDYRDVLLAERLPDQLNLMSRRDTNPQTYRAKLGELITRYGIWEWDLRE